MPRQRRLDAPDTLHHAMVRGVEQRVIVRVDADRTTVVARLAREIRDVALSVIAC
jgi:hypothetical protein